MCRRKSETLYSLANDLSRRRGIAALRTWHRPHTASSAAVAEPRRASRRSADTSPARAGHVEGPTGLEAKGARYDHLGLNWPYELAKGVAAFASSPQGALLCVQGVGGAGSEARGGRAGGPAHRRATGPAEASHLAEWRKEVVRAHG